MRDSLLRLAVLIPCYNESSTILSVVRNFRRALPHAETYVFDNNSTDNITEVARNAGAVVRQVACQGKGNAIRRRFADIDADAYVLVDGEGTYDAKAAAALVARLFRDGLDMVVARRASDKEEAYRSGHRFDNIALTRFVASIVGRTFTDMLSGYRVFSHRYVKSFPAHLSGFETETELTVHALELRMPVAEVATKYRSRPEGSVSKLNTYRDGLKILGMILKLFRAERPLAFFSIATAICVLTSVLMAIPLLETYFATGLVPRFPTAILCAALVILGGISLVCGIVLDTVTQGRDEAKRFAYLMLAAPGITNEPVDEN